MAGDYAATPEPTIIPPRERILRNDRSRGGHVAETVTVRGRAYYAHEVNYLLWGMINRLAFDSNIDIFTTGVNPMTEQVLVYRRILYPGESGTGHEFGRMSWARAGWVWAGPNGHLDPPAYWSLTNVRANPTVYPARLRVKVGGSDIPAAGTINFRASSTGVTK